MVTFWERIQIIFWIQRNLEFLKTLPPTPVEVSALQMLSRFDISSLLGAGAGLGGHSDVSKTAPD